MAKKKFIGKLFSFLFIGFFIITFIYLIYDLAGPLQELLFNQNRDPFEEALSNYGIWKYIIMILLNTIQVFLTVMPGEPVQLLSGITCGILYGICVCLIGIAIGNTLLYVLINNFNMEMPERKKQKTASYENFLNNEKSKDKKSFTWFILGLYFAPIIPYGVIAYTAAKGKMKYFRYILVTTLGTLPSILTCITASNLLLKFSFSLTEIIPILIIGLVLFIIIALIFKYKKQIVNHILNRSIRATILWLLPLIILTILLIAFLLASKYYTCAVFALVIVIYIIMYAIYGINLSNLFTSKKMDYFKNNIVLHQNRFIYWFFSSIFKLFFYKRLRVKLDKNGIEKFENPSIVLFNHGSAIDFINVWAPIYPQNANMVSAYYYFCNFHLGRLLNTLGCFPKFLYQPDISAIKNMHKVIKSNNILLMAPEGRLSPHGQMESYIPSTIKFLKKEGVDVYVVKSHGAYFTKPKWSKTFRKGRIDTKYYHVFTKEDLQVMTYEEIYKKLYDVLYYDDYKWMTENNVTFKGKKFAEGLEHILYICPVCGKEFTYTSKNNMIECSHCHTKVKLNRNYFFECENPSVPKTISDWYNYQKEIERKRIKEGNYTLKSKVLLKHPDPKGLGFTIVGSGEATLSEEGIRYIGTINDEQKDILFKLENIPALPYGVGENFEIYHDQTLYYFIPENIRHCAKWSVVEEQMYINLQIKNNKLPWDV